MNVGTLPLRNSRPQARIDRDKTLDRVTVKTSRIQSEALPSYISHSFPDIDDQDVSAVIERLRTGQIAAGPLSRELESRWARHLQVSDDAVLMVASGTHALYLALRIVGVGTGDVVLMPAYACRALADAVAELGAEPAVVDVDRRYGIDRDAALQRMKETNRVRAAIAVHPFGSRIDLTPLETLGCPIIEDCAHAPAIAPSPAAAATVYSFQATKLLASGEGGAVVANSTATRHKLELVRRGVDSTGRARGRLLVAMSDLTSALCLSQLDRWPTFSERRRKLARSYRALLGPRVDCHAWSEEETPYRWLVRTDAPFQQLQSEMHRNGIAIRRPIEPLLHHLFDSTASCPTAEDLYRVTVSLPLYPALDEADVSRISEAFVESLHTISRATSTKA